MEEPSCPASPYRSGSCLGSWIEEETFEVMMIFGISFFALVTGAIAQRFLAAGVADAERDLQSSEAAVTSGQAAVMSGQAAVMSGQAAVVSGEQEVLRRLQSIEQQLAQLQTTLQGSRPDG